MRAEDSIANEGLRQYHLRMGTTGPEAAVDPRDAADSRSGEPGGMDLPPVAPMLMQSLRSVGYSTPAAVADLIDNSIAAEARSVSVRFAATPDPFVAVIDDGTGMDEIGLVNAMRFGSRDPREARSGADLGRFGLGLKTASLSQCRRLTVATKIRNGKLLTAVWDLDECDRRGTWWLDRPGEKAVHPAVLKLMLSQDSGTAVAWQNLDRLLPIGSSHPQHDLDKAMDGVADHLALTFHRYLAGEFIRNFDITINGRPLQRLDPFLEGHPRGQELHEEAFTVEGHPVKVSPFVLPFPSRLKPADLDRVGGRESLKAAHGFYVYRGGRLVVPGGWYRIVPADELVRLARIRVDVPVELDHIWKVDVRKTMAEPPAAIRPGLKRIVGAVTSRSRKVYTHRGTPVEVDRLPMWVRHEIRDGAAAWRVNREHPVIAALASGDSSPADLERLLKLIEQSLPIHDIHIHISNDLPVADPVISSEEDLEELARRLLGSFDDMPEVKASFLARLAVTEPFSNNPEATLRILGRLGP
jgi:Histidine kinase-, DNA gyrase B-, and HSP90-like ATPase